MIWDISDQQSNIEVLLGGFSSAADKKSRDAAIATCKRLRSTWLFPGAPRAMDNQRYKVQTTVSRVEALEFLI